MIRMVLFVTALVVRAAMGALSHGPAYPDSSDVIDRECAR